MQRRSELTLVIPSMASQPLRDQHCFSYGKNPFESKSPNAPHYQSIELDSEPDSEHDTQMVQNNDNNSGAFDGPPAYAKSRLQASARKELSRSPPRCRSELQGELPELNPGHTVIQCPRRLKSGLKKQRKKKIAPEYCEAEQDVMIVANRFLHQIDGVACAQVAQKLQTMFRKFMNGKVFRKRCYTYSRECWNRYKDTAKLRTLPRDDPQIAFILGWVESEECMWNRPENYPGPPNPHFGQQYQQVRPAQRDYEAELAKACLASRRKIRGSPRFCTTCNENVHVLAHETCCPVCCPNCRQDHLADMTLKDQLFVTSPTHESTKRTSSEAGNAPRAESSYKSLKTGNISVSKPLLLVPEAHILDGKNSGAEKVQDGWLALTAYCDPLSSTHDGVPIQLPPGVVSNTSRADDLTVNHRIAPPCAMQAAPRNVTHDTNAMELGIHSSQDSSSLPTTTATTTHDAGHNLHPSTFSSNSQRGSNRPNPRELAAGQKVPLRRQIGDGEFHCDNCSKEMLAWTCFLLVLHVDEEITCTRCRDTVDGVYLIRDKKDLQHPLEVLSSRGNLDYERGEGMGTLHLEP
jgi:hypothetical protein